MSRRTRAWKLAGTGIAAAALFVAGAVAASADTGAPPEPTTTAVESTSATTLEATPSTTTADAPATTAATTTATTTSTAATTTPAPAATTTTYDPWRAWRDYIAALQAARRAQRGSTQSPTTGPSAPAPATPSAPAAPERRPEPPPARLTVGVQATPDSVVVGSTLTYTVTVANAGGTAAEASLSDPLPPSLIPVWAETDQGSCTTAQTVTCSLGSIRPGQSVTVAIVVQVKTIGPIANQPSVTAKGATVGAADPLRLTASAKGAAVKLKPRPKLKPKAKPAPKRKQAKAKKPAAKRPRGR